MLLNFRRAQQEQTEVPQWRVALTSRFLLLGVTLAVTAMLRLGLGARGWVAVNSDEASLGLMADNILWHGEHPIFLYGQHYLGALPAYLATPFFALFGPTSFALHASTTLLMLLFLMALYAYTSGVYSPAIAWCTVALLGLGPPAGLFHEQEAANHTQNLLLFGVLLLWLVFLRLRQPQSKAARIALDLGIGLAAGLGLWGTPLMLFFVLAAALALGVEALRHYRAAPGRQTLLHLSGHCCLIVIGAAIGLAPWMVGTIASRGALFKEIQRITGLGAAHTSLSVRVFGFLSTFGQRLAGTFLISLPQMLGNSDLCASCPATFSSQSAFTSPALPRALLLSAPFSLLAVALWAYAVVSLTRQIKPVFRLIQPDTADISPQQQALVRARWWGQAMLVTGGALTVLAYMATRASYEMPLANTRYLVGIYLCMPLLIAPLWRGSQRLWQWRGVRTPLLTERIRRCLSGLLAAGLLAALFTIYSAGAVHLLQQTRNTRLYGIPAGSRDMRLLGFLHTHEITHFYGTYWACYRLMFEAREHVTCAVIRDNNAFAPGFNRISSNVARMDHAPHPAYIFDTTSPIDQNLYGQVAARLKVHDPRFSGYREATIAAYRVYYYAGAVSAAPGWTGWQVPWSCSCSLEGYLMVLPRAYRADCHTEKHSNRLSRLHILIIDSDTRREVAMELDDFLETEVAAAVAATAALFSPRVRKVLRRGLVYTVAGGLIAGEVATSAARGIGRGVQQGMASARQFGQEGHEQGKNGHGGNEASHE